MLRALPAEFQKRRTQSNDNDNDNGLQYSGWCEAIQLLRQPRPILRAFAAPMPSGLFHREHALSSLNEEKEWARQDERFVTSTLHEPGPTVFVSLSIQERFQRTSPRRGGRNASCSEGDHANFFQLKHVTCQPGTPPPPLVRTPIQLQKTACGVAFGRCAS